MAGSGRRQGPAALLAPGCHWLDASVSFVHIDNSTVFDAECQQLWQIAKALREARGRRRLSVTDVADAALVRRQTVTDIELGVVWPDAVTLAKLCQAVGLRLAAVPDEGPGQ